MENTERNNIRLTGICDSVGTPLLYVTLGWIQKVCIKNGFIAKWPHDLCVGVGVGVGANASLNPRLLLEVSFNTIDQKYN